MTRMRTAKTKRRQAGRRRRWPAIVVLALLWLGGIVWSWPDLMARIVHPARFATTGAAMLPLDAYAAAAAQRLPAGDRIGEMILPTGRAPVIVIASRARLWLDPPTARVLAVAAGGSELVSAEPAQGVAVIARRARAVAPGRIARVVWPGSEPGQPDWLVTLTAHDRETVVKVADDTATGGAAVARIGRWRGSAVVSTLRWALLLVPPVLLMVAMTAWRRRKPKRRGRPT
jgi:hypothetical protein